MKKYLFPFCALALAGCGHSGAPDSRVVQLPADGPIAETVNGTPVPQTLLEAVARQHNWHLDQPGQRQQTLKLLTDMILIAQEAQREKYADDPKFQADVEAARLKAVGEGSVTEFEKRTPLSDTVLKAEYDAQIEHTGKLAYDFTQMLFDTEDEALKVEAEIVAGKAFPQVYDAWRSKAKQARAFTRVRLDQIPPDLAKVLSGMQNGETTKVPIKTQFGWHVVHLDITNPYAPPAFEQARDGIRRTMQLKIDRERMDKLREQAKIEYPPGTPPPAAPQPGAAVAGIAAQGVPAAGPNAAPAPTPPADADKKN
jgi:peptidyl-prolyl cis-trans isomerase C